MVGTGLPGVGSERELLKGYFDRTKGNGFDYAYLYPGMNKVLQAGGRVIRSESDRGSLPFSMNGLTIPVISGFSQRMGALPESYYGFCGKQNRKILDRTDKSSIIKLDKHKEVIIC